MRLRIIATRPQLSSDPSTEDLFEVDETIDASLYAIYKFHMFEADDPRVVSTCAAVEQKLWVKTRVGGLARYENDYYHRISNDIAAVPGNPLVYLHPVARGLLHHPRHDGCRAEGRTSDLRVGGSHALESGVLAEQVNPYTNAPISVSPLTWSHATVVSTAIKYLEKPGATAAVRLM